MFLLIFIHRALKKLRENPFFIIMNNFKSKWNRMCFMVQLKQMIIFMCLNHTANQNEKLVVRFQLDLS